uniref:Ubiquitin carboxyl-terminal hydrolase 36 n=1 Tax=Cacopsylla melanoneura TaxID=428564 RepID=A0A8D8U106_9HEMI
MFSFHIFIPFLFRFKNNVVSTHISTHTHTHTSAPPFSLFFCSRSSRSKPGHSHGQPQRTSTFKDCKEISTSPQSSRMFNESQVGLGLENLGATCYINSTLQALFHIPSFYNLLVNDSKHQLCENECLVCAMRKTLAHCQTKSGVAFQPDLIYNKLKLIAPQLSLNRQEDSQEFLMHLIQGMHESYLKANKLNFYPEETTPINQLFGFEICIEKACPSCLHVSTTYEHHTELSLAIHHHDSLDKALKAFFQKDLLQEYTCQNCGEKVEATMQSLVNKPPNVLQLQLKRFALDGTKLRKLVHKVLVPQQLELGKYFPSSSPADYKLVSAIIHHGPSIGQGHYTCIGSTSDGVFYEFNDEKNAQGLEIPNPSMVTVLKELLIQRTSGRI